MNKRTHDTQGPDDRSLTFWEVMTSVLAAALGVQSKANKERDFSRGKPIHFVMVGILFTGIFLLLLVSLVNYLT